MNILGIETSCDETAAAVIKDGKWILSNVVATSLEDHKKYGGIIPEIASRRQMEFIKPVVTKALKEAKLTLAEIDAIAVTHEPGLIGSLLVGVSFARALSFSLRVPLIMVDHIKAHLYANFLSPINEAKEHIPKLPAVGLVVSGGHTSLYYLDNFTSTKIIGRTKDDAVGEAYDKVARLLGLGYPGGPAIDKLAKNCKKTKIRFASAKLPSTLDFSFSGIKTAVLYYDRDHKNDTDYSVTEVTFAFQKSVVDILVQKCLSACQQFKVKTLLIGGGVAANSELRHELIERSKQKKISVFFPPMSLCTDNAAMIAGLGYQLFKKKENTIHDARSHQFI